MSPVFSTYLNTSDAWPKILNSLAESAIKYGPFFFSVLFLTYIVRWAQAKYNAMSTRQQPPVTPADRILHGIVFIGSFVMGIGLVIFSVFWWFRYSPNTYVYKGVFKDLQKYEQIDSDANIFFHTETRTPLEGETDLIHNVHFLVVQPTPFVDGEIIPIDFFKGEGKREHLQLEFVKSDSEPSFTIEWDPQRQKNVIKSSSVLLKPVAKLFLQQVYAASLENWTHVNAQRAKDPFTQVKLPPPGVDAALIESLQNSRSDVGTKIAAIEGLGVKDKAERDALLSETTETEPVLVTMLDLTRHSDRELASKTIDVLQGFDSDTFVIRLAKSTDTKLRSLAETDFFHMERPQAERIIHTLETSQSALAGSLVKNLRRGMGSLLLRPTGAPQGDRYYVQATWEAKNTGVTTCLTNLFNRELLSQRTMEEETAKMRGRSQRLVYWYTKDWAIMMANKIQGCGGEAQFVIPNFYRTK